MTISTIMILSVVIAGMRWQLSSEDSYRRELARTSWEESIAEQRKPA
ncbi:MAG: hypothetical protein ACYDGN_06760 [Acidimicrobiales bacterium]